MKKIIRYVINPIVFLGVYILAEYLIRGSIDLKMTIVSTAMYTVLNAVFHILLDNKLE